MFSAGLLAYPVSIVFPFKKKSDVGIETYLYQKSGLQLRDSTGFSPVSLFFPERGTPQNYFKNWCKLNV
jgi:hypothetical protein